MPLNRWPTNVALLLENGFQERFKRLYIERCRPRGFGAMFELHKKVEFLAHNINSLKPGQLVILAFAALLPYSVAAVCEGVLINVDFVGLAVVDQYRKYLKIQSVTNNLDLNELGLIRFDLIRLCAETPLAMGVLRLLLLSTIILAMFAVLPFAAVIGKIVEKLIKSQNNLLNGGSSDQNTVVHDFSPLRYLYLVPFIAVIMEILDSSVFLIATFLINEKVILSPITKLPEPLGLVPALSNLTTISFIDKIFAYLVVGLFHCMILLPYGAIVHRIFNSSLISSLIGSKSDSLDTIIKVISPQVLQYKWSVQRFLISLSIVSLISAYLRLSTLKIKAKDTLNLDSKFQQLKKDNQINQENSKKKSKGKHLDIPVKGLSKINKISEESVYKN